ncbi:U7 snRNA-associated Sm-like protein LSm11 [Daphnia pulicaria]|uniref:U7 snRNA-associated Sm-like protein LSm11 n=1 Tax=Daphnia pulicaria TaxID=35523 RepID=UPI001EEC9B97|nr:U7 snRNA-associated Sm-like protein LSm11 [Daphnia pulicaria]
MDKPNELDFSSSEFNALEALLSPDVTVPVPEAPMYDNLGQFVSTLNRARAKQAQGDGAGPSTRESNQATINTLNSLNPLKRKFLPHQEPVMGRGRSRPQRNLLTRMDEVTRGPMSVLRNCMINKTRVKVWIRGATWIRGFCIGYIAAFDKQWNLAMTDVDETFTRRRHRKTPILGPVDHITEALGSLTTSSDDSKDKIPSAPGPSNQRKSDPLTGLAVQRQPIDRREELCQRHVQQLFIRGEQVFLILSVELS